MKLVVIYPAKPGARFDFAYYLDRHAPLVQEVLEPQSVELLQGVSGPGGAPPSHVMIATFGFASPEALEEAMGRPRVSELMADVDRFTDIAPAMLFGADLV